jgi:hypothetical protein
MWGFGLMAITESVRGKEAQSVYQLATGWMT